MAVTEKRIEIENKAKSTQAKLEIENKAKSTQAKLPKLRISPVNVTPADWIRFENIFTTQEHEKPISDEEKFRENLLEMVNPKTLYVRLREPI